MSVSKALVNGDASSQAKEDEWQVLQSIYPEFIPKEQPKNDDPFSLNIPIQLSEPLQIHVISDSCPDSHSPQNIVIMSHLPSVSLNLTLPSKYPSQPPTIHSIHPSYGWLDPPLVERLTSVLLDMWDNECILGAWVEHIQNGDQLLSSLDLLQADTNFVRLPNSSPSLLSPLLVAYNATALEMRFEAATHTCPICLTRLSGTHCISLTPCGHVACRSCLREFWANCVSEGDVTHVGCPDPMCVKDGRQAVAEDVKLVVSAAEVERWQWLLRKREIEKDPTITYCPVLSCQLPVRPPTLGDGQESGWERLRTCDCGFSFCVSCRRSWHGAHTPCVLLTTEQLVQEYLMHPEMSAERKELERVYGRRHILRAVESAGISKRAKEEGKSHKWIHAQTTSCPRCQVRVEKILGYCNHITCSRCGQHFCYRCGERISASMPTAHFHIPGHPCHNKLFDEERG